MRRLLLTVAVLGTVVLVGLAFRGLDWSRAWDALRHAQLLWLLPSFALFVLAIAIRALRWRSLFLPETRPSGSAIVWATLLGYLYLSVLPIRMGEPARIIVLHRLSGTSKVEITGTAIVERVFDLVALLVCFFVLEPWLPAGGWARALAILAGVAGLTITLVVFLLRATGDRGLRVLLRPFGLLPRVGRETAEHAAVNLRQGLAGLHDRTTAVVALTLTTVSWVLLGISCSVAMRAFHLHVSALAGMLVVVAVSLAAALPSLPGGLGIFEAASVAALKAYGVAKPEALAFGVVWHLLNLVPFIVVGAPLALLLARRGTRLSSA
jgi:uncharacterized protein (TIRG00374 family)